MKLNKTLSILLSLSLLASDFAYAGRGTGQSSSAAAPTAVPYVDPTTGNTATTPTTSTTTTTQYTYNGPTIKEAGAQAAKNTNTGMYLGIAAAGAFGYYAMQTCPNPYSQFWCRVNIAGLVAAIAVTYNMLKAKQQSGATVAAVTTDFDAKNVNVNPLPDDVNKGITQVPPEVKKDPDWQAGIAAKKKLEKEGWKFDLNKQTVVGPKGEKVHGGMATSTAGFKAAGGTSAQLTEFQAKMKEIEKKADAKAKGADGSDMFADGDAAGGGGIPKVAIAADGKAGLNFQGMGGSAEAKSGINRDPAQVAGMKKDFNGSPIGVSADSLFDMVDRRYQLHQQNGSFLSP